MANARKMVAIGKLEAVSSTDPQMLHCNLCLTHEQQELEDQLIREVGGPSPEDLLRVISSKMPWFLDLSKASPEAKLTALAKLKRQMDHTSTDRELGLGLASGDPLAVYFMDKLDKDPKSVSAKARFILIRGCLRSSSKVYFSHLTEV